MAGTCQQCEAPCRGGLCRECELERAHGTPEKPGGGGGGMSSSEQAQLQRYAIIPEDPSPRISRNHAREWFLNNHDIDQYRCPQCDRAIDRAGRFDVHHINGDPTDNRVENLTALCRRCHIWEHHDTETMKGLDVHEWKLTFCDALGIDSTNLHTVYDQRGVTE